MDGGSDRRVWDFTGRGEGLRKTTSLLGRAGMGHGPVHWSANFDEIQDFEHDIRGPFGGKGFLSDADFNAGTRNRTLGDKKAGVNPELDALAAYVASLDRVNPSPYRNPNGSMTSDAMAGRRIFHRADVGCAVCHGGPQYTYSGDPDKITLVPGRDFLTADGMLLHDVGTMGPGSGKRLNDSLKGLDIPTLKGIWEMPPYLHDGSAPTLMDVITTRNPEDKHGKTSHLSTQEKGQLVAFLLQLDETDSNGIAIATRPKKALPSGKLELRRAGGARRGFALEWPGAGPLPDLRIHDLRGRLVRAFPGSSWLAEGNSGHRYWLPWPRESAPFAGIYFVRAGRGGKGMTLKTALW
jgi:hypothetical protein